MPTDTISVWTSKTFGDKQLHTTRGSTARPLFQPGRSGRTKCLTHAAEQQQ